LDAKGEKMSKAKGNVVDPWWVINSNSADALRWYMLTATLPGNVRRFDVNQVKQVLRRFLLTLWNTYSFFVIYANIDRFDPSSPPPAYRSELDRWIISKLNLLIQEVTTLLDNYDPTSAGRKIEEFVEDLSNWYVRRSRRRFWKSENDEDKQAAYFTLYHCLTTLCKLLAPFTPFIAEEMYQNLVRSVEPHAPLSVHLTDFPIADLAQIDHDLISSTHLAMKISSLGRAARSQTKIKVRQPLSQVLIKVKSKGEKEDLAPLASQVLDELNVKDLGFMEDEEQIRGNPDYSIAEEGGYVVAVNIKLSPELLAEGKAREIVHRLQTMRRSAGFNIADYIVTYYETSTSLKQVMLDFAPYIKQETLSRELLEGVPQEAYKEKHRIADEEILLGVKKLI
jgi:isoleucyl-tRNA synthetase